MSNRDIEVMLRPLGNKVLVLRFAEGVRLEYIPATTISLEHSLVYSITKILLK